MKVCPRCSDLYPDHVDKCHRDGSVLRAVVDPLIGKTFGGRFRLIQRLGTGGMSKVYLARHVLIDRLMAIKVLRQDLARDPVQRDRFLREARAVNRINHDNIVEITDFGEADEGLVYLVMEYVPGESLLATLAPGPFSSVRALDIAEQCASALGRAHQMGVIHRDLKPENILLVQRRERRDFVKILDFGIAKILDAPSLTGSQQIFGTPGYIAPEYIQSTIIDGRADIYSLGCILYEMVTGRSPFDYDYPGDLLVKHVTELPIRPSVRLPTVEAPLEELILRALAKDPAHRFRDAFHFKAELIKVRERLGPAESWGAMAEPAESRAASDTEPEGSRTTAAESILRGLARTLSDEADAGGGGPSQKPRLATAPYGMTPASGAELAAELAWSEPTPSGVGLAIPKPPALAQVMAPSAEVPASPEPRNRDGLVGVRRWRERFDAIRAHLDDVELRQPAPSDVAHAMAFAERTLEDLEGAVAHAQEHQEALELLHESARDFRSTLGRTLDAVAGGLSEARGELESLATRRNALRTQREAARLKMRRGIGSEGEADVLLWELAAVEHELGRVGQSCDALEAQLADLTAELEQHSGKFEHERGERVAELDARMVELESRASALRGPLELAEAHVRAQWPGAPSSGMSPA